MDCSQNRKRFRLARSTAGAFGAKIEIWSGWLKVVSLGDQRRAAGLSRSAQDLTGMAHHAFLGQCQGIEPA